MDVDTDVLVGAVLALGTFMIGVAAVASQPRPITVKKKRKWVRHFIKMHDEHGAHAVLVPSLREHDANVYLNFLRMPEGMYMRLLRMITPYISRQDTNYRKCISPSERLTITLRFLAIGASYKTLSYQFYVGASTISELVPEICQANYDVLHDKYIKFPKSKGEWRQIASDLNKRWQLPHCLGALDGKHVRIRCPRGSGSTYFNYKKQFSIVLMALVDSDYQFRYINVGAQGRVSDGGVFNGSTLDKALRGTSDRFPNPDPLPGDERKSSYFVIGPDAFALQEHLMKGYGNVNLTDEQKILNYRFCRGRRAVENAFEITCSRSRVLLTTIMLEPENADKVILASCAIHNFLRQELGNRPFEIEFESRKVNDIPPASWRSDTQLASVALPKGHNPTLRTKPARDYLKTYLNSDIGSIPWQNKVLKL